MTPRAYYRELDRHVVRIEAPGASPFDPDVAIPVRANAPAPDEWTTLVRALEPVAPLEPADNPAGKGLLAITCDSETWTTVHRFAGQSSGVSLVWLADECFGRPSAQAIRFLVEACLICLASLDEERRGRTSRPGLGWDGLREALLEASFPFRSVPILHLLRRDLVARRGELSPRTSPVSHSGPPAGP